MRVSVGCFQRKSLTILQLVQLCCCVSGLHKLRTVADSARIALGCRDRGRVQIRSTLVSISSIRPNGRTSPGESAGCSVA